MSVKEMARAIQSAYPKSETWALKVQCMSDSQVIAIYYDFKRRGKV